MEMGLPRWTPRPFAVALALQPDLAPPVARLLRRIPGTRLTVPGRLLPLPGAPSVALDHLSPAPWQASFLNPPDAFTTQLKNPASPRPFRWLLLAMPGPATW